MIHFTEASLQLKYAIINFKLVLFILSKYKYYLLVITLNNKM